MDTKFKKGHKPTAEVKAKIKDGLKRSWKERSDYHGMYGTKFYNSWRSMTTRCRGTAGPESKQKYYDKGIKVCDQWQKFSGFYQDMYDSYIEGLTIDRIDNNKGYYKENCRWATTTEQAYNKSQTVKIEFNGEMLTMKDAAELIGISTKTLRNHYYRRFKKGLISLQELFDKNRYSKGLNT